MRQKSANGIGSYYTVNAWLEAKINRSVYALTCLCSLNWRRMPPKIPPYSLTLARSLARSIKDGVQALLQGSRAHCCGGLSSIDCLSAPYYLLPLQSSPDGRTLGDCPFTHRTNLALKLKGVNTTLVLINLSTKPEWFKKLNPAGTVPVLEFGNETICDSYEAVRYLDKTHPNPPLDLPGNKEAEEVTGKESM